MPAKLKGSTEYVVPENAKPGDTIKIDADFVADQDDFERALAGRLAQQKRQHEAEKQELSDKLKALESKQDQNDKPDPKLQKQIDQLSQDLAQSKLAIRIEAQLKKQGLTDIPQAYRDQIKVKADASDEDLASAVESVGGEFKALKESLGGGKEEAATKEEKNLGRPGSGGSNDKKNKTAQLMDKVQRFRPDLEKMLNGLSDEQTIEVLQSWENQGVLAPPTKK